MKSSMRGLALAMAVLALALFIWQGWSFGFCLQDDTYISLRYARHLATGQGLVFNLGERVEGYTNFLWTVALAPAFWLGVDPERYTLLLSVSSGLLALLATTCLAGRLNGAHPLGSAAAGLLVAAFPGFVAESVMGLETVAFALLVVAALARRERERQEPTRAPWISGLLLALATLTRPEGGLVALLCFTVDLWERRQTPVALSRLAQRWIVAALPVLTHLLFRWSYYGDLVPNTFHAKVGHGLEVWKRGLGYAGDYGLAAFPLVLLALPSFWPARDPHNGRRTLLQVEVSTLLLAFVTYVVFVGGDYKGTYRFFLLPTLLLAVLAGRTVTSWAGATLWRLLFAAAALLIAAALSIANGGAVREFASWRRELLPVHRQAGQWLAQNVAPDRLMAAGSVGVLPFFSELRTIDMYGLCDRQIALREMRQMGTGKAGHEKGDGKYVLSRQPDLILFQFTRFTPLPATLDDVGTRLMGVSEHEIWGDPEFLQRYRLRSVSLPGFAFNFFERVDKP